MAGERLAKGLPVYRKRYAGADRKERSRWLDEFCGATGYHRKYAIALLKGPADAPVVKERRRRGPTYSAASVRVLERIWKSADYPWSERLKAMLPLWLPWARQGLHDCTSEVEKQLLKMSARQMDRRLAEKRRTLKRRDLWGAPSPARYSSSKFRCAPTTGM